MKDTERRRLEMFIRVREFGVPRSAQFPSTSFAGEQFTILDDVINALETHTSAQESGKGAVREGTSSAAAALDEVMRDLEALNRTARAMAMTTPGLANKFRVPHNQSNQAVLAVARAQLTDAQPLKAEFIKRGMPADFLEDLQADIEEMEQSIARKAQGAETRTAATEGIDDEIDQGMKAARELDPIMRNTFANDPATLAAWLGASHVERHQRRAAAQATATDKQPTS